MLLVVVALLGNGLVSAVTPMHAMPASAVRVTDSAHTHHHDCCPPAEDTGCAATCAASATCGTVLALPVPVVAECESSREAEPSEHLLQLYLSITSLPESPPPRI